MTYLKLIQNKNIEENQIKGMSKKAVQKASMNTEANLFNELRIKT